jgi:hypothetical protein
MAKRNKLAYFAAVMASTVTLASCNNTPVKTTFDPYWQTDILQTVKISETLTYEITFKASEKSLNNYGLKYETGSYVTTLNSKMVNGEMLYVYETQLNIKGELSFEDNVHTFEDSVTTSVEFKNAANGLAPIQSTKTYVCHSPRNVKATAETKFADWKETGEVKVNHAEKTASILRNSQTTPYVSSIYLKKEKHSWLDNEQVLTALRAVHQADNAGYKFHVYAPFTRAVQTVSATFGKKSVVENFALTINEQSFLGDVSYFPVTLILDEKDKGSEQELWIAACTDVRNNTHRNVILKNVVYLPYSYGSLTYTLKTVSFSESN